MLTAPSAGDWGKILLSPEQGCLHSATTLGKDINSASLLPAVGK